jgi:predicted dehydrogenase
LIPFPPGAPSRTCGMIPIIDRPILLQRSRQMDTNKRIRMGISGLGAFDRVIATVAHHCRDAELVTCFDPDPARRERYAGQFGMQQKTGHQVRVKRPDIGAVLPVLPNTLHSAHTRQLTVLKY